MFKKSVSMIIVLSLLLSTFVYAESDDILTIEKAIEMALEDRSSVNNLDDSIEDLWKNYNSAVDGKRQIEANISTLNKFEKLYKKQYIDQENLSPDELYELEVYQSIYGDEPPNYSSSTYFELFVQPRDFTYYSLYAEVQKLKNTRKTIDPNIERAVKNLYIQVLELQATVELQNEYLEISTQQHDQLDKKHSLGQVSTDELVSSELNLEILSKQIEQLNLNFDSLLMNFNQLIETNITETYRFVDYLITDVDKYSFSSIHRTLDEYLDDGIMNRAEVKNARIALDVKEREDSIIKDYISVELSSTRINSDIALLIALNDLEVAEANVTENITDGYINMMSLWKEYLLSVETYNLANNNFNDMNNRFELGQVTNLDLILVEYNLKLAENTVDNNLRNYINAVTKLDDASSIGPAY